MRERESDIKRERERESQKARNNKGIRTQETEKQIERQTNRPRHRQIER